MIQVSSDVTSISTKTKYTDFCVTCANEDIGWLQKTQKELHKYVHI